MKHLALLMLLLGCTKELKYSKEELLSLALKADPTASVMLPKSMKDGVRCEAYTEGCVSAHIVQVQSLDFIAVEFMNEEQAKFGAKKVRGFYLRNWLFDDVTGEPVLERFVENGLKAKRP